MKKVNYFLILLALVFASLVLFVSLQSANKKLVDDSNMMSSKFYVAKEILPDHSLYPLLMAVDRVRLEMADSQRKTSLLVAYGNRRLYYSRKLLEKGNTALAFTTLGKAMKYMSQALEENIFLLERDNAKKQAEDRELATSVLQNSLHFANFINVNKDQFSNEDKVLLESLLLQNSVLAEKLQRLLVAFNWSILL